MSAININRFNQNNEYNPTVNIDVEYSSIAMRATTAGTGFVGYIIPIFARELIPSQKVDLSQQIAIQFAPFTNNLLHEFTGVVKTYFVPYRLLDENWEDFIQGGVDGKNAYQLPYIDLRKEKVKTATEAKNQSLVHTILDYMGYPINSEFQEIPEQDTQLLKPQAYPVWAYNKIYNDHIRPIDLQPQEVPKENITVLKAIWQHDYFTRARIYQQRGAVPMVPLENATSVNLNHQVQTILDFKKDFVAEDIYTIGTDGLPDAPKAAQYQAWFNNTNATENEKIYGGYDLNRRYTFLNEEGYTQYGNVYGKLDVRSPATSTAGFAVPMQTQIKDHVINLEGVGINLNSLYIQMGIMSVLINNAKIKYRYVDWLQQRFGVQPEDARMQLPEYLGTQEIQIQNTIVTQQSYGDVEAGQTPQGYMTSQASAQGGTNYQYTAKEHGIMISVMEIKPASVYEAGLDRLMMTKTRFEYPTPELVNMPDRPIYKGELFYTQTATDRELFGWGGVYDEYRTMYNRVVGLLRPSTPIPAQGSTLSAGMYSYTLARYFTSAPSLNLEFVQMQADMDRVLQYVNEPDFLFMIENRVNTAIPLPLMSNPAELLNL